MVGPGLRKLAQQNGMNIGSGVAYGSYKGFAATFSEGSGYKRLAVTTKLHDEQAFNDFRARLYSYDLEKEFRIFDVRLMGDAMVFTFRDNVGTMKKFTSFCDLLCGILQSVGADGANICNECGTELIGGSWKLINGVAFHLHEGCAEHLLNNAALEMQLKQESSTGSIGSGIIGALLGALVGAVPWTLLLYAGYFAAIAGLLVGWCSKKGYELLHGKNARAKLPIVIVCVVLAVFAGNFAADYFSLFSLINDGLINGLGTGDIIPAIVYMLSTDDEYLRSSISNLILGLVFALLGAYGLFKDIHRETGGMKMKALK